MNPILTLVCILLIPLAAAGLALIHQGLGRSRSAAHTMLATLCALAVAAIVFALVGFSLANELHLLTRISVGGGPWHTPGVSALFARSISFTSESDLKPALTLCFDIFAVGLAAIIPISAGSDRWRLGPTCGATALLAVLPWPVFAHWVWNADDILAQLPAVAHIPAFTDLGGAGVVQVVGGLMALSVVWIVGPRRGKYSADGLATAIPGHNIVLVLLGCLIALVGWIGLDAAAFLLFHGASLQQVVLIVIDCMLAASAGALAVVLTTRLRYRKPDASLAANGWIAGLVAASAGAGVFSPLAASVTGIVAGVLVAFLIESFELRLLIDDPGGAISVHAGAGLWGLLAVAIFVPGNRAGHLGTLLAQLVGIVSLLGIVFPLIHAGNLILNRFIPFRVDRDGDWQGMDIRELGAGAYPEFVVHADEFIPR